MSEDLTLSAGLRRLWGVTPRAPGGGRQGLSVERVVTAAVAVADAEGLEAVSMSRVASDLGFTTMALYRHVESKEELLELMVDVAAGDPPELPADDWRAALERWTVAQRELMRQRPWIAQAPISGIPIGPHQVGWMEAALQALRDTPLDGGEKLGILLLLTGQVRYESLLTSDLARARERAGQDQVEMERAYGRNLAAILDPQRFPEMAALVAEGLFDAPDDEVDADAEFALALTIILDGIELLIDRRAAGEGR